MGSDHNLPSEASPRRDVAAVAIGRNEGERLKRCLRSLVGAVRTVVYVDSGSMDGSVDFARELGVEVVELDMSRPFTAARARNAGFERAHEMSPDAEYIYFTDGDCEMVPGWLDAAAKYFNGESNVAVVAGRLREVNRQASVYNRLCEMEWQSTPGEAAHCGGIFVCRRTAFREIGGFVETMIAGEDPEFCARLRQADWRVVRLADEMARHDADMHRFGQWWKRSVRSGHAYAENATRHGRGAMKDWAKQARSNWFWGLMLPLLVLLAAWPTGGWSLLLLAAYPAMVVKIARYRRRTHGDTWRDALLYGGFVMLGKWPNVLGQITYYWHRLRGRRAGLIEYKGSGANSFGTSQHETKGASI